MEYLQVGSQFLYSLGSLCVSWAGLISFIGLGFFLCQGRACCEGHIRAHVGVSLTYFLLATELQLVEN